MPRGRCKTLQAGAAKSSKLLRMRRSSVRIWELVALLALLLAALPLGVRVPGSGAADEPPGRRIAVTFDDLPLGYASDRSYAVQKAVIEKLLATLAEHRVPAVGFVNEEKLYPDAGVEDGGEPDPRRVALLQRWLEAGHELGNHTYSHPDLHRVPLKDFQRDVLRGERVLREIVGERDSAPLFFRHPFLHTGRSLEVKHGLESFLADHGYRVAPVTVDNSEWIFALAYDRALTRGDAELARRVAAAYPPYLAAKVAYFERNSRDLFGREIPQVLLVHANRLNADHFGTVVERLEARGYAFLPLGEALEDPAYESPDNYTGPAGLTWLHRWALTRGVDEGFFRDEPKTPPFVLEAAGVESE